MKKKIKSSTKLSIKLKAFIIIFLSLSFFFLLMLKMNSNNIKIIYANLIPYINSINQIHNNLKEIFDSRRLYIPDANLTNEYIHYIRPIKENDKNKKMIDYDKEQIFFDNNFIKRKDQLDNKEYAKLCVEEKLIYKDIKKVSNQPFISIILASFNKEKEIMKSIRSIQNQSLKNIEIIIVDDCSTDNTTKYYNSLLETDPRIRLFYHLKNKGVWRTRIDGLLYSKGKYAIFFDVGDLYEDNYVLEDAYNVMEKYNLDSLKMFFRLIFDYNNLTHNEIPFNTNVNQTKVSSSKNLFRDCKNIFGAYDGVIWNALLKSDVYIKGLYLLNNEVLNIYKNLWEDRWWTRLMYISSRNLLSIKRFCYLYYKDVKNDHLFFAKTEKEKDRLIHEFVYFLYFDMNFLPKEHDKKFIIDRLIDLDKRNGRIALNNFRTKFYILDNLVKKLIEDPYVNKQSKTSLQIILNKSYQRQKLYEKTRN